MTLLLLLRPRHRRGGAEKQYFPRYVEQEKKKRIRRTIRVFRKKIAKAPEEIIASATIQAREKLDEILSENPLIDLDKWLEEYLEMVRQQWLEDDDLMVLMTLIDEDMRRQ